MHISISTKQLAHTHLCGYYCQLPASCLILRAFPTRLEIYSCLSAQLNLVGQINFSWTGFVEQFTVSQDLERGKVLVWGKAQEGFFRYECRAVNSHCAEFFFARLPTAVLNACYQGSDALTWQNPQLILQRKERFQCTLAGPALQPPFFSAERRFSLGCHRAARWPDVALRRQLSELLPYLQRLGQWLPADYTLSVQKLPTGGVVDQLTRVCRSIEAGNCKALDGAVLNLCEVLLFDLGVPQWNDALFRGLTQALCCPVETLSPLLLLAAAARTVEELFIKTKGSSIYFIPSLPSSIVCGKLTHWECPDLGTIWLEWTKRQVRRVIFVPYKTAPVQLHFPANIKKFRLRTAIGRGEPREVSVGEEICFEGGHIYYLDHFKK